MEFMPVGDARISDTLRREGVAFIDSFLDPAEVVELRAELDRYIKDVLPSVPRAHHEYHANGALRSMTDMHRYDDWFREFGSQTGLLDLFRRSVDWDLELFYLEIFPKAAHTGPLLAHQELFATPMDPPHYLHLWIALEDVTTQNAGLYFYRRSHRLGLAPHVYDASGLPSVEGSVLDRMSDYYVQPDYPAGSAALFDGRTIHGSLANVTDRMRLAMVVAVRGVATKVSDDEEIFTSVMARFFREAIGIETCGPDEGFFLSGGDGAAAEQVLKRVEREYQVSITPEEMATRDTPRSLALLLIERSGWGAVNA